MMSYRLACDAADVFAGVAPVAGTLFTTCRPSRPVSLLHIHGLADSADGLVPHLDGPARRRAVMAAPDVGAFGIAAVAVALVLRWSAFASIEPDPWLVAAVWCASRSCMAIALVRVPYVGGGLGSAFAGASVVPAFVGLAVAIAVAPEAAAVAVGAVAIVSVARRRLGGVTGDVLGAAGVVGETLALVLATAGW